jgi:ATP synthase F1 complex assembly factor 1
MSRPRRNFSFSFVGPKTLDDVIKKELVAEKSGAEVADIWYSYHENKENVIGLVLDSQAGKSVLSRAQKCPFFVQPVFRDDGFFMMVSQFQSPGHFLMAYLEDYKMDPQSATPLLTFSVFDDLADNKDVVLVRADILNKSIQDDEGRKVVRSVLDNYRDEEHFVVVKTFNERPDAFDIDDYISRMNIRWQQDPPNTVSS